MLKKIAVMVGVLMILGLAGPARAAYKEVSLNGDWDFTFRAKPAGKKGQKVSFDIPELPDASSYDVKLRVPDYMNMQIDRLSKAKWWRGNKTVAFKHLEGIAFYRKSVSLPADWADKSIQLYIGRAYDRINVWINGKHRASHPYTCLVPASIDLSGLIKPGQTNEIIIAVDNRRISYDYWKYGGIVELVCLQVSSSTGRIDSLYIRPGKDLKEVSWQVDLKIPFKGKSLGSSKLNWVIKEWNSQKVLGKGSVKAGRFTGDTTVKWRTRHSQIKSWHPNHPNLYVAVLSWEKKGEVIDTLKQRFGLRRWSSEERNLKLNGKPLYLRQLHAFIDAATHYRYPQNKEYWLKYLQLLKDLGYNSVDWYYDTTVSQEALEAADEIGMVVQTGSSHKVATAYSTIKIRNRSERSFPVFKAYDIWTQVARWTRKYPSMCIYCITGEANFYEGQIEDITRISKIIKSIHPESMLLPNHAMRGIEYSFLPKDVSELTMEPFPHHAERLERVTKCSDIFGCIGSWFSYHPFNSIPRGRYVIYKRPVISHEAMESTLPLTPFPKDGQFTSLRYGKKGLEYLCNLWGYPLSRRIISRLIAGQEKRRSRYNSFYTDKMWRLHSILSKYVFEKLRKCDNVAGYQDMNGHGNLNLFLEPGPGSSIEGFRRYNSDNVLLLDWDKGHCLNRCYWGGDKFNAKVMVSVYGEKPLQKGTVAWKLKENNKTLLQGAFKTEPIPNGKVTILKDIEFIWPEVSKTSKLNLSVKLSGADENINNDWDFWVFKKRVVPKIKAACTPNIYRLLKKRYRNISNLKDTSTENLRIVDILTGKTIKHLEEGGDVLLIGGKPFPLFTRWPTFNAGWRTHHTLGTIVYEHPVFKDIPHQGWADWQFYPLLEGAYTITFANRGDPKRIGYGGTKFVIDPKMPLMKDVPFNPILEITGRSRVRDFASIFELTAGKGRLFVTTCMYNENPVCVTLMDSILEYVSSPEFRPASEVKLETLRSLVGENSKLFLKLEVEAFSKKENVEVVSLKKASKGKAVKITGKKSLLETYVNLRKGTYSMNIRGYGPVSYSDSFYITIDDNKKQVFWFDQWCTREMGNIVMKEDGKLRIAITCKEAGVMIDKIEFWKNTSRKEMKAHGKKLTEVKKPKTDLTAPVMKFVSNPPIDIYLHRHLGTEKTVFTIEAEDKGSGVGKIEISIDGGAYKPYKGGFSFKRGVHSVKCRCADKAGNITTLFKGASEERLDMKEMVIKIK